MPRQGLLQKYIDPNTTISNLLAGIPAKRENRVQVMNYLIEKSASMEEPERIYIQTLLKRKIFHPEKFLRKAIPEYVLDYFERYIPNTVNAVRIWRKNLQRKNNPEEKLVVEIINNCIGILAKNTDFLNQLQDNTEKILRSICRLIYEISDIVGFRKDVLQQELIPNRKQSIACPEKPIRIALELYRILKGKKDRFYLMCSELLNLIEKQTNQ